MRNFGPLFRLNMENLGQYFKSFGSDFQNVKVHPTCDPIESAWQLQDVSKISKFLNFPGDGYLKNAWNHFDIYSG